MDPRKSFSNETAERSLSRKGAHVVIDALATATGDEGISEETSAAEANGSVAATAVGAGFAVSVITAGVRVAQVALIERSALVERMTSESIDDDFS